MIERGVEVLTNLPPRIEAGIGAIGTIAYGSLAAAPDETKEVLGKIPMAGNFYQQLLEIPSQELLSTGSAMLAILCIITMYDGVKRMIAERNQNNSG